MKNFKRKLATGGGCLVGLLVVLHLSQLIRTSIPIRKYASQVIRNELEVTPVVEITNSSTRIVFYNRIAKCGSRSLRSVANALQRINHFTKSTSPDVEHEHPPKADVLKEMKKISKLKSPAFYDRHIHYLDFKAYNYTPPIYINMIREPIERFVSHYNYIKHGDQHGHVLHPIKGLVGINDCVMREILKCNRGHTSFMFFIGMHFCGHDKTCETSSKERIELAKKHIDEDYTVIGMTEEFENTLRLLERMLPDHFKGAIEFWLTKGKSSKAATKTKKFEANLTAEAETKLRNDLLKDEYEVYHHAKRKFERLKIAHGIL